MMFQIKYITQTDAAIFFNNSCNLHIGYMVSTTISHDAITMLGLLVPSKHGIIY